MKNSGDDRGRRWRRSSRCGGSGLERAPVAKRTTTVVLLGALAGRGGDGTAATRGSAGRARERAKGARGEGLRGG